VRVVSLPQVRWTDGARIELERVAARARQVGARRFDVGQRTCFTLVSMAIAALSQLREWQIDRIAITLQAITDRIEQWAREHDLQPLRARDRGPHLLEAGIPADAMQRVPQRLTDRNVHVGVRGATGLRISPHLHTTDDDLARFYDALKDAPAE
jgi:selenocysteine lyase/cysteine desulfurase